MTPDPDRDQWEADILGDQTDHTDAVLEDAGTWHDPLRYIDWQAFRINRKRGDRE